LGFGSDSGGSFFLLLFSEGVGVGCMDRLAFLFLGLRGVCLFKGIFGVESLMVRLFFQGFYSARLEVSYRVLKSLQVFINDFRQW